MRCWAWCSCWARGRPTTNQVALALATLGVDADEVRLAPVQNLGRTLMLANGPDGPLDVTVLGRDERDARFVNKAWRFLVYRDSGPTLFHSRLQEVEHEAYLILRAEREGIGVSELVEVGQAGPDAALLVTRTVEGRRLANLSADELDDACLHRVWVSVAKLQDAGLAHGNLDARHVWIRDDGAVTLVGLRAASSAAPPSRVAALVTVSAVPHAGSNARGDAQRCCSRTSVGSRHPG